MSAFAGKICQVQYAAKGVIFSSFYAPFFGASQFHKVLIICGCIFAEMQHLQN